VRAVTFVWGSAGIHSTDTMFHIFDATCIPELSPEHLKWHGLQLTSILKDHPLETTRAHSVLVVGTLRLSAC